MNMKIKYQIIPIEELKQNTIDKMFQLMEMHYENTFREKFESDLAEKKWVITLVDCSNEELAGFSIQMTFMHPYQSKDALIIFSGDTIIKKEYWGSPGLTIGFCELMLKLIRENSGKQLYWMLISKGIRTYKFLPAFLKEYYPNFEKQTPFEVKELMDSMGLKKFGEQYDITSGVVVASLNSQFLKADFQPKKEKLQKFEDFFYKINPGFYKGDELLCIAELSLSNLNPYIIRLLKFNKLCF